MNFHTVLTLFIFMLAASAVKGCREHERAFVFRLGRLILPPRSPGIFLTLPFVDRIVKINLRSEKGLEEAERLLWEAKMQKDANQMEIERHLSELAEIRKKLSSLEKGGQDADKAGV